MVQPSADLEDNDSLHCQLVTPNSVTQAREAWRRLILSSDETIPAPREQDGSATFPLHAILELDVQIRRAAITKPCSGDEAVQEAGDRWSRVAKEERYTRCVNKEQSPLKYHADLTTCSVSERAKPANDEEDVQSRECSTPDFVDQPQTVSL